MNKRVNNNDRKTLLVRIKHLENELYVIRQQHENTTDEYLKVLEEETKANRLLQQEIEEQKRIEKTLRHSEEKYRNVIEHVFPVGRIRLCAQTS